MPVIPSAIHPETNLQRFGSAAARGAKRLSWFVGVGAFAYAAQHDPFLQELWQTAKIASPFGAMLLLILLFDERGERREAQGQLYDRTVDYIQSNYVAAEAIDRQTRANDVAAKAFAKMAEANTAVLARLKTTTPRRQGRKK